MNTDTTKRYRLLDTVKTIPEWCAIFPFMWGRDFADDGYGFEEVLPVSEPVKEDNVFITSMNIPQGEVFRHSFVTKNKFSSCSVLSQKITAALNDTVFPSVDEAGVIALKVLENVTPKLNTQEQALFISGFQECIKYLKLGNDTVVEDSGNDEYIKGWKDGLNQGIDFMSKQINIERCL